MDVAAWCNQNGITKANYYYRLRRVRKACLASAEESGTSFIELQVPKAISEKVDSVVTQDVAAVLHSPNGFTLEISNHASAEFIRSVVGAITHAE
ncbi:MAG: hypothetical protein Q4F24_15160 [Eubacteriales bacterium]|nr:hypothetical protein [Eubacteriales bacterium]